MNVQLANEKKFGEEQNERFKRQVRNLEVMIDTATRSCTDLRERQDKQFAEMNKKMKKEIQKLSEKFDQDN